MKSKALQTAGNLAFCRENRRLLLEAEGFKEVMIRLADQGAVVKHEVRMSAIRALAILGELFLHTSKVFLFCSCSVFYNAMFNFLVWCCPAYPRSL